MSTKQNMSTDSESSSFPIVDISNIDERESQLDIAREITEACQKWGFLLIKGHSIPTSDINEMFSLGKSFFTLPAEQKEPWPVTAKNIGYIGALKDSRKDDKMSMWFGGVPGSLQDNEALPLFWHAYTEKVEGFTHKYKSLGILFLIKKCGGRFNIKV
jgi:non-haem dioxygenase in morphine synthesis N-terminal